MKQNKMMAFIESNIMPIAGRIGSQRHLIAIRDGFIAIMPLIIIGSLAILVNNFPIPAFQNFMTGLFGEGWTAVGGAIWNGSFALLSLLAVAAVSFKLAESYHTDGLSAALIGIGAFAVLTPTTEDFGFSMTWLGAQGLFVGLIVALLSTEVFRLFPKMRN